MTFPVVPVVSAVGSAVLGAGAAVGVEELLERFTKGQRQKPRNLDNIPLSEAFGPNATLGQLAKSSDVLASIARKRIGDTQALELFLQDEKEKRRQQSLDSEAQRLTATRENESGISEREREASLGRTLRRDNNTLGNTITDRDDRVTQTLRLRTGETNLEEGARGKNYARTMGILDQGNRQLQGFLGEIIKDGREDQERQMAFIREMHDRERAAMNSPLNMIGRIAGIALPALALFGR